MNLYILRHASAGVRRKHPQTDRKRGLDKEGKQQCMLVGRYLGALRVHFDAVISSPLKRSLQTATLVATESGFDGPVVIDASLAPDGTHAMFEELLRRHAGVENLLVVGHNPNLSNFLGALICAPHRANIRLRKASLARVDCTRRPAQLLSLVDPRSLKQVYASVAKRSRRKTSRK
jgi:phosphohistidine phosphatase